MPGAILKLDIQSLQKPHETGTEHGPVLQLTQLRLRKERDLSGHMAAKWWSWELNPNFILQPRLLKTMPLCSLRQHIY